MLAVNDCNRILLINSTKTRLARAVNCAMFSVVLATPLATLMVASPAIAQSQAETSFDIAAGPLAQALSGFASEPAIIVAAVFVISGALAATGIRTIRGWCPTYC